ncbi:MAG TPA: hypothetical protein VLK85_13410 [Ramlibacter sp.]|nr:hypothetical protein [Ramlibacter sp.]
MLDYAVRMKRFPPGALFCERLEAGTLDAGTVDRFAQVLAAFHAEAAAVSAAFDPDGSLPLRRARAALAGALLLPEAEADALGRWLDLEWERCRSVWLGRLRDGRVREGHGDQPAGMIQHRNRRNAMVQSDRGHPLLVGAGHHCRATLSRCSPEQDVTWKAKQLRRGERSNQHALRIDDAHKVPVGAAARAQALAQRGSGFIGSSQDDVRPDVCVR